MNQKNKESINYVEIFNQKYKNKENKENEVEEILEKWKIFREKILSEKGLSLDEYTNIKKESKESLLYFLEFDSNLLAKAKGGSANQYMVARKNIEGDVKYHLEPWDEEDVNDEADKDEAEKYYQKHILPLLREVIKCTDYNIEKIASFEKYKAKQILYKIKTLDSYISDNATNDCIFIYVKNAINVIYNNVIGGINDDVGQIIKGRTIVNQLYRILGIERNLYNTKKIGDMLWKIHMSEEADMKNKSKRKIGLNTILYGPPGTGKTYNTIIYAVSVCRDGGLTLNEVENEIKNNEDAIIKEYNDYKKEGRIEFITFHQSYGYEEFIQGIRPNCENNEDVQYEIKDGIFKRICNKASVTSNFDKVYDKLIDIINKNDGRLELPTKTGKKFEIEINSNRNLNLYVGEEKTKKKTGVITKEKLYEYIINPNKNKYWLTYFYGVYNYIETNIEKVVIGKNSKNYVLIIDEINRGNISKIFGELITLIEEDKRRDGRYAMTVRLPYQTENEEQFGVPSNVYILGTMNTADRSITHIDTALRRRFDFIEMMPKEELLNFDIEGVNVENMLKIINKRIERLYDREHMIGHAYFIKMKNKDLTELGYIFKNRIIPLLQEYFYDDYKKIQLVLGDDKEDKTSKFISKISYNNDLDEEDYQEKYKINEEAFFNIESYLYI